MVTQACPRGRRRLGSVRASEGEVHLLPPVARSAAALALRKACSCGSLLVLVAAAWRGELTARLCKDGGRLTALAPRRDALAPCRVAQLLQPHRRTPRCVHRDAQTLPRARRPGGGVHSPVDGHALCWRPRRSTHALRTLHEVALSSGVLRSGRGTCAGQLGLEHHLRCAGSGQRLTSSCRDLLGHELPKFGTKCEHRVKHNGSSAPKPKNFRTDVR